MPVPAIPGIPPFPEFGDLVAAITKIRGELVNLLLNLDSLNVIELTADHISAGTIDANVITITAADGTRYYRVDSNGIVAYNGTQNTLEFDLNTGLLTLISMLIRSTNNSEKIVVDSTGFHSFDSSGVERIEIGTTPSRGAKALMMYGSAGPGGDQSAITFDTETVDGSAKTGQYFIGPDAQYLLFDDSGNVYLQRGPQVGDEGFRIRALTRPEMNAGGGWAGIAFKSEADAAQSTANSASSAASSAQSTANSALSGLSSKADTSYVNSTFGVNLTFDTGTRNLKMFADDGTQIAIVNIP